MQLASKKGLAHLKCQSHRSDKNIFFSWQTGIYTCVSACTRTAFHFTRVDDRKPPQHRTARGLQVKKNHNSFIHDKIQYVHDKGGGGKGAVWTCFTTVLQNVSGKQSDTHVTLSELVIGFPWLKLKFPNIYLFFSEGRRIYKLNKKLTGE